MASLWSMSGSVKDSRQAVDAARRFCEARFAGAALALLCGSWARGSAHVDSDLDLFVLDDGMKEILFEGVQFDDWIVEVCALSTLRMEAFFRSSALHRSAPIPKQVLDGILILGEQDTAAVVKGLAWTVLEEGPQPLSAKENLDLRWNLTCLLSDLSHVADAEVLAVAAQCHSQLALAALDGARHWRGERKALRRTLLTIAPGVVERLDHGLRAAVQGDRLPLLEIGREILGALGGSQRTYVERF